MIEVEGLTVRFAGVTPIDDMSVVFPGGTCGLIGPNGAGKTTFFNVLSGFVKPAAGSIAAFGESLLSMADYKRARWGLRRTFQTEMAIEKLSIYDNVAMIHEHSGAKRASRRADVLGAIDFVGLEASPKARVGGLGARERRLVEIARAVVGSPRVVLLDEPAAGLPDEETMQLGRGDPEDSRAVRGARHSRRSRHEPGFGLLRDDGSARLRKADRFRADGGCASQRARDSGLPGHGGSAVSERETAVTLRFEELSVARGGRPVVREVSIEIPPAEVTILLGANGAGKSTLVLAVAGILRSTGGRVMLGERDLTRLRPEQVRAAGVAVVPEGRRLLPDLTVEDNLRVATYSLSREHAKSGIAYALELFPELEKRWRVTARLLSGGEQQMVVLAQALVSRPRALLVDELSLGLAPVVVKRLVPTLQAVAESGVGVLADRAVRTRGARSRPERLRDRRRADQLRGHCPEAEGRSRTASLRLSPRGAGRRRHPVADGREPPAG